MKVEKVVSYGTLLRRFLVCLLLVGWVPLSGQAEIIFDDDFEDTVDATQSNLERE